MAAAALPGLNFGPEVTYILAAILIITGLALAFYGHGLWTTVMAMIGALLTNTSVTPGLAGLGVFLLGALVQTATIKKKQRARTRAAATPPPPPPPPPSA